MSTYGLNDIYAEIERQAASYSVEPWVAKSLLAAENTPKGNLTGVSSISATKTSPAGATGLFQLIPDTETALQKQGRLAASSDPLSLPYQVSRGLAAISEMQQRQKRPGDPLELAVMYNAGTAPHKSYLAGGAIPAETQQYLQKVKNSMAEQGITLTPQQIEQMAGSQQPGSSSSSSSQRTSTSSQLFDPVALAQYQTARGVADTAFLNAQGAVQDATLQRGSLGMDFVQSLLSAGDAAGAAAKAQTDLDLAAAAQKKAILAKANLDPALANNRMEVALQQLDETSAQIDALRPEIDRKLALSFFDNPLEWVAAQVSLPGEVAAYNNLTRLQGDQISRYDVASKIADGQITRSQATQVDEIGKLGAAKAQEIAAKAAAAAKQAQIQVQASAVSGALQLAQMAQMQLGAAERGLALTRERQTVTEGLSQAEQKAALEKLQMDKINAVLEASGSPNKMTAQDLKLARPAQREALMQAGQRGTYGADPAEAFQFLDDNSGGLNGLMRTNQAYQARSFASVLAAAEREVDAMATAFQAANPGKTADRSKVRLAAINKVAGEFHSAAESDMYRQSDANPYKIDYQRVLNDPKLAENLANNSYAQTMLKLGPGGAESIGNTYDEQRVMSRLLADIRLSKNPQAAIQKAAADISGFYTAAMLEQQKNTQYNMFGFRTPTRGYPMMMQQINNGLKIDMADRTMVERALTQQFAMDKKVDYTTFGLFR